MSFGDDDSPGLAFIRGSHCMKAAFLSKVRQAFNKSNAPAKPASSATGSGISQLLRNAAASGGSEFQIADSSSIENVDVVGVESAVPSRQAGGKASAGGRPRYITR